MESKYFIDILANSTTREGLIQALKDVITKLESGINEVVNEVVETENYYLDWDLVKSRPVNEN
jgi:hypothetical protein